MFMSIELVVTVIISSPQKKWNPFWNYFFYVLFSSTIKGINKKANKHGDQKTTTHTHTHTNTLHNEMPSKNIQKQNEEKKWFQNLIQFFTQWILFTTAALSLSFM